jgi:hypothetical protein
VFQREWDTTSIKRESTKIFFPTVKERISKRLPMYINVSTIVTGHRKLRSYYHRFKIIDDPKYLCKRVHKPLINYCGNMNYGESKGKSLEIVL